MTIYKPWEKAPRKTSSSHSRHRCPASRTVMLSSGCGTLLLIATCRHNPSLVLPETNMVCHKVKGSEVKGST